MPKMVFDLRIGQVPASKNLRDSPNCLIFAYLKQRNHFDKNFLEISVHKIAARRGQDH